MARLRTLKIHTMKSFVRQWALLGAIIPIILIIVLFVSAPWSALIFPYAYLLWPSLILSKVFPSRSIPMEELLISIVILIPINMVIYAGGAAIFWTLSDGRFRDRWGIKGKGKSRTGCFFRMHPSRSETRYRSVGYPSCPNRGRWFEGSWPV